MFAVPLGVTMLTAQDELASWKQHQIEFDTLAVWLTSNNAVSIERCNRPISRFGRFSGRETARDVRRSR